MSRPGSWGQGHAPPPGPTLQLEGISFPKVTAVAQLEWEPLPPTCQLLSPVPGNPCWGFLPSGRPLWGSPGWGGDWAHRAAQGLSGSGSPRVQQNPGVGGSISLSCPCGHTAMARRLGGGRKPQHPAFHPGPRLLCICLFTLEKAPWPRQEMGQFQEARLGWGTRSRIVFHARPLPALGLLQEP